MDNKTPEDYKEACEFVLKSVTEAIHNPPTHTHVRVVGNKPPRDREALAKIHLNMTNLSHQLKGKDRLDNLLNMLVAVPDINRLLSVRMLHGEIINRLKDQGFALESHQEIHRPS